MDNTATFSCSIGTTDSSANLDLEIWLNQEQIFNIDHVKEIIEFTHEFDGDDAEHELRFIMKNKTYAHTQVDKDNNIVYDASVTISNIAFEGIVLDHVVTKEAVYTHDFNGTQPKIKDTFFGVIGCNGTVSLKFTTPIYIWLLEHL
jgi:hypothetical protein